MKGEDTCIKRHIALLNGYRVRGWQQVNGISGCYLDSNMGRVRFETLMGQGGIVMEANAVQDVGRGCTNRQAVKQKEGMAEKWTERKTTRTK